MLTLRKVKEEKIKESLQIRDCEFDREWWKILEERPLRWGPTDGLPSNMRRTSHLMMMDPIGLGFCHD